MAVLSVLNNIFMMIARYGYISIGIVLSIVLSALWSAASFILGFITIVLLLRFFAYITSRNTFSPFWRIIDAISRPILYRLNRIFFRNRLVNYKTEIITALAIFAGLWVGIGLLVKVAGYFLMRLPI
jgi:YggT family protein